MEFFWKAYNNRLMLSESSIKKVFYVHPVSGTGGALEALLRLVTELDTSKHYPKVICPELGASYHTFKIHGIDVDVESGIKSFSHFSAGWYSIKNAYKFITNIFNIFYSAAVVYKVIKIEKPDLVHLSSSVLLGPGIGAKAANAPVVWHIREYLHDGYFGVRKWIITRLIDKLSNAIICITDTDASRLKPSKKINVVYDSVNFNFFDRNISSEKFKSEFKIKGQDKVIGMFGGISRIKGTIEFTEAAKEILEKHKNFKFLIFGPVADSSTCTFRTTVKNFLKQMISYQEYSDKVKKTIGDGFGGRIKLVGNRQDIPEIMAGLDFNNHFPQKLPANVAGIDTLYTISGFF